MSDRAIEMIEAMLAGRHCSIATYPDEEQWLAARRKGIGGSDAAAITGESRFATKLSVWAAKLNTLPPIEQTEAMYAGGVLENSIAIWASEFLDLELVDLGKYTIIHGPQSIAFATLDRVMIDHRTSDRAPGICEIKNVNEWAKGDWEDWLDHQLAENNETISTANEFIRDGYNDVSQFLSQQPSPFFDRVKFPS